MNDETSSRATEIRMSAMPELLPDKQRRFEPEMTRPAQGGRFKRTLFVAGKCILIAYQFLVLYTGLMILLGCVYFVLLRVPRHEIPAFLHGLAFGLVVCFGPAELLAMGLLDLAILRSLRRMHPHWNELRRFWQVFLINLPFYGLRRYCHLFRHDSGPAGENPERHAIVHRPARNEDA